MTGADDLTVTKGSPAVQELARTLIFGGLPGDQLDWLAERATAYLLNEGDVLFAAGAPAETFYVLLTGSVTLTKNVAGRERMLGVCSAAGESEPQRMWRADPALGSDHQPPGSPPDFIGEIQLLTDEPTQVSSATATTMTRVVGFNRAVFHEVLERCPGVYKTVLPVFARRLREQEAQIQHGIRLTSLETLASGLAHELNNPAAALVSDAVRLRARLDQLDPWARRASGPVNAEEAELVRRIRTRLADERSGPQEFPDAGEALDASEADDALSNWLLAHGLDVADGLGAELVEMGVPVEPLEELAAGLGPGSLPDALGYLAASLTAGSLVDEIIDTGRRVVALVGRTKTYTNLNRADQREIDVHEGLDASLAMRPGALDGIRVHRDYDTLPPVAAFPAELNLVWTSLVENAVEAISGEGDLWITTRSEAGEAVIEIRDNGHGIAPEDLPHVFEPFFTTKGVGAGTGLGLHRTRDVVTNLHNGAIEVRSGPRGSRFIVRLPFRKQN